MLTGKHIRYLAGVFGKVCSDVGAVLAECNGEHDHIHLLAGYPSKVSVAALVNSLDGVPAQAPPAVPGPNPPEHLWSPSYFAASCGGTPLSIIR